MRLIHRSIVLGALAMVLPLAARAQSHTAPASAPDPARDDAKRLYKEGVGHYDLKEYQQAVEKFRAAFRAYQDPTFLYNIAQAYRMLENYPEALDFYRNFLRRSPNVPDKLRHQVEQRIAELEKLVEAKRAATPVAPPPPVKVTEPPPPEPPAPTPTPSPAPAAAPVPALAPAAPAETPPVITATPAGAEAQSKPIYKKPWFWYTVGGVVVVATAVTIFVATSGGGGEFGKPIGPGALR